MDSEGHDVELRFEFIHEIIDILIQLPPVFNLLLKLIQIIYLIV